MAETPNEFKLDNAPEDGISSVRFCPTSSQFLLVSSWDCKVHLYDVLHNKKRLEYYHQEPVLDCCFQVFKNLHEKKSLNSQLFLCFKLN